MITEIVGGPDLSAHEVEEMLGFKPSANHATVHWHVRRGHFPGYINTGEGWTKKNGSEQARHDVYFYLEDIEKYKETLHKTPSQPGYHDELKELTLQAVQNVQKSGDRLTRMRVWQELQDIRGHTDKSTYGGYLWKDVKAILDEAGYPTMTARGKRGPDKQKRKPKEKAG